MNPENKPQEKTPHKDHKMSKCNRTSPNPNPFYLPTLEKTFENPSLNESSNLRKRNKSESAKKRNTKHNRKDSETAVSEHSLKDLNLRIAKFNKKNPRHFFD